jgi:hypothetical protein
MQPFWRTPWGIAVCALLAVAGLSLLLDHRDHALQYLPYLLVLACPLMHFFMPGHGHGGWRRRQDGDGKK